MNANTLKSMVLQLLQHEINILKNIVFYKYFVSGILLLHVQWSLYAATVRSQDTSRMSVEASQSAIPAENPDILPKVVQCRKEGFLKRGYAITVIDQDILLWIVPTRRRATIVARLDIWQGIASIVPCAMAAANRVTLYEIVL